MLEKEKRLIVQSNSSLGGLKPEVNFQDVYLSSLKKLLWKVLNVPKLEWYDKPACAIGLLKKQDLLFCNLSHTLESKLLHHSRSFSMLFSSLVCSGKLEGISVIDHI